MIKMKEDCNTDHGWDGRPLWGLTTHGLVKCNSVSACTVITLHETCLIFIVYAITYYLHKKESNRICVRNKNMSKLFSICLALVAVALAYYYLKHSKNMIGPQTPTCVTHVTGPGNGAGVTGMM
jgi:heme/copper-type cytochrome/quinol oxidase subunit 4